MIEGRKKNLCFPALVIAAFMSFTLCAAAQNYEEKSRQVDKLFERYGPETPGVSIRVVKNGKIVHSGDYGMASLEHGVPISSSTVFAIGSNSKQFTAFGIALLAERGVIDLDADVRTYVPEVPEFGETITVRQLIHHVGGIRDWVRAAEFAGFTAGDAISLDLILEFIRRQKALNFPPGERYMYSNTGYVLLAEVISRATGEPYPEWMKENIFDPLGMTHTQVRATPYGIVPNMASSYYPAGDAYLNVKNGLSAYGSCCILSTIDDMAKWLRNYETASLGGEALIDTLENDSVNINKWDGRLVGYSFGLMRFAYKGLEGFFHSGQWVGFRSATLRVPEQNLSIVALGNNGPSGNLREWDVLEIYAQDKAEKPERANDAETPTIEDLAVDIDERTLDSYAGVYNFGTDDGSSEILTVKREGDKLVIKFTTDREPSTWTAISENEFKSRPDGRTLGFKTDGRGPATAALWRGKAWPRTEPFNPDENALQEFAGTFLAREIDAVWRLAVEDGNLVARQWRWRDDKIIFSPTVTDEFRGDSAATRARFVRNRKGKVIAVLVSGRRTLDIEFVRVANVR
ncbi:MAG: serine hydrolase domain-containing protein [Parvularculaceae bacterium]